MTFFALLLVLLLVSLTSVFSHWGYDYGLFVLKGSLLSLPFLFVGFLLFLFAPPLPPLYGVLFILLAYLDGGGLLVFGERRGSKKKKARTLTCFFIFLYYALLCLVCAFLIEGTDADQHLINAAALPLFFLAEKIYTDLPFSSKEVPLKKSLLK